MYRVSTQGVDERTINVHSSYYYYIVRHKQYHQICNSLQVSSNYREPCRHLFVCPHNIILSILHPVDVVNGFFCKFLLQLVAKCVVLEGIKTRKLVLKEIQNSRLLYYLIRKIKTWLNINHITVHNSTYCIF